MENGYSKKRKANLSGFSNEVDESSPKRRVTYSEKDAKLARIFERLADNQKENRVEAAIDLVHFVKSIGSDALNGETRGQSLGRILTRLFRGLCSNRKAARLGYFAALLEILPLDDSKLPEDNVRGVVSMVKAATDADQGASKQELRDHLRGRLNGYSAIFQSGTLASMKTPDQAREIIQSICAITSENRSLRQEGGAILCELIRAVKYKGYPLTYPRIIIDEMCSQGLAKSAEGVAIWLEATSTFHDMEMPRNIWHHRNPLAKKELTTIISILKHGQVLGHMGDGDGDGAKQQSYGARQATPHFVWYKILDAIMQKSASLVSSDDDPSFKNYFVKFWLEAVDNIHFAQNASLERKSLGLQIFSHVAEKLPIWTIKVAFSPNLSGCLCNQAAKSERYLHQAAVRLLKIMTARAKSDEDAAVQIIETLTTGNGVMDFDKRTNSKTISSILTGIPKSGLDSLITSIIHTIRYPQVSDEKQAHSIRHAATDNLLAIIRNRNSADLMEGSNATAWLKEILITFVLFGLVEPADSSSPPLTKKTQEIISARLSSCLSYLVSGPRSLILDCLVILNDTLRSQAAQDITALKKADEGILSVLRKAHITLDKIIASSDGDQLVRQAYQLLFSMTVFQAYSGETEAFGVLERLQDSYAETYKNDKFEAFDAVTEEIMGFVSKQSALYRKLGEQTFGAFTASLSEQSLTSMLDVLGQQESLSGQQALFEDNGDVDDVELINGSETSEHSSDVDDVELVNDLSAEAAEDAEEEDSSAVSVEEVDDEDDEAERFDKLLADTLKTKILDPDAAKGGAEDDSSSDESMDDEQMMAIEPQLTKVFQERKKVESTSKKQERKDARQNIINFKNRVLDLLLIYVKQQHANPLAFDLILPLLQLVRTTSNKQVSNKATELLRQYFDTAKAKGLPSVEEPGKAYELVGAVHLEALKFPSKLHASACSRSSLFLAKCLVAADPTYRSKLGHMYADTLERAIDTSCGTPASFWTDFSHWLLSFRNSAK